jgi:hypothetical protein
VLNTGLLQKRPVAHGRNDVYYAHRGRILKWRRKERRPCLVAAWIRSRNREEAPVQVPEARGSQAANGIDRGSGTNDVAEPMNGVAAPESRGHRRGRRPRITVELVRVDGAATSASPEVRVPLVAPSTPVSGNGLVADSEMLSPKECEAIAAQELGGLEQALAVVTDMEQIRHLNDRTAVVRVVLSRIRATFEAQNRLAEVEIRCLRKVGELLREEAHRGGRGSKYSRGTSIRGGNSSPLPKWVSRNQSSRCQKLAAIPEDQVQLYFARTRAKKRLASAAALLRAYGPKKAVKARRVTAVQREAVPVSAAVLDAVARVTKPTVSIGLAIEGVEELQPDATTRRLAGSIVVAPSHDVASWLTKLAQGRQRGHLSDALVLLPTETGAAWFRLLPEEAWTCCFLRREVQGAGLGIVAYIGEHNRGFELVFQELGAVWAGRSEP